MLQYSKPNKHSIVNQEGNLKPTLFHWQMLQLNAFWHLVEMTVFSEEGIELKHLSAELHSFIIIFSPECTSQKYICTIRRNL